MGGAREPSPLMETKCSKLAPKLETRLVGLSPARPTVPVPLAKFDYIPPHAGKRVAASVTRTPARNAATSGACLNGSRATAGRLFRKFLSNMSSVPQPARSLQWPSGWLNDLAVPPSPRG